MKTARLWNDQEDLKALCAEKIPCEYGSEELARQIQSTAEKLGVNQTGTPLQGAMCPRQNPDIAPGEAMDFIVINDTAGTQHVWCDPQIECKYSYSRREKMHRKSCFSSPNGARAYFYTPRSIRVTYRDPQGARKLLRVTANRNSSLCEFADFSANVLQKEITGLTFYHAAIEGIVRTAAEIAEANKAGISTEKLFMDAIATRRYKNLFPAGLRELP